MAHTLTTCTFCGAGCGLYLETSGRRVVGVYPSMSHPSNEGRICVRGWHVHEIAGSPDRLTQPMIKRAGIFHEASWDDALELVAARLAEVRDTHGPDAIAFLTAPRCANEDAYLLQKLARCVIGTNNVDHGAGVYSNNSTNVLLEMIGVPASTNAVGELQSSDVIFVDGVDLARQLPTVGGRVIRAKLGGATLVVIDSRRHRVAESADIFLQIKPGTEVLLYGAMAKVILDRGLMDLPFVRGHCIGYEEFVAQTADYDLLAAADACGVEPGLIESAALAYGRARSAALLYSTGIESRDADAVRALVNLALLTGNIGKTGSGIYALTEHNNLQGVCDMGALPDRLPGYRPVDDDAARAELEALWNVSLPARPGVAAREVLATPSSPSHPTAGIKALLLCRYDPVGTAFWGEAADVLDGCEFVVAQHLFMTGTAMRADVVLPAAAYGEERVTFTSTDRRIQVADQVAEPHAGSLPTWLQLTMLARAMGADWQYDTSADVMEEIRRAVPFYGGADHQNLLREYGRQWPCTTDHPLGTRTLFADGYPKERFRFVPVPRPPVAESPEGFPLTLFFGHSLYYWHQSAAINHSETLKREYRILLLDYPDGFVDINIDDARDLGIRDGQQVRLTATTGSAVSAARVTSEVRKGAVLVPYFVRQVHRQIRGTGENGVPFIPVRVEGLAA